MSEQARSAERCISGQAAVIGVDEVIAMTLPRTVRRTLALAMLALPLAACGGHNSGTADPSASAAAQTTDQASQASQASQAEQTDPPAAEGTSSEAPGPAPQGAISVHNASLPFGVNGEGDQNCYNIAITAELPAGVTVRVTDIRVDPASYFTTSMTGCGGNGCSSFQLSGDQRTCTITAIPTGTGKSAYLTAIGTADCPAAQRQTCLDLKHAGTPQELPQPDSPPSDVESVPPSS